jgi:hypothetical protein
MEPSFEAREDALLRTRKIYPPESLAPASGSGMTT